MAYNLADLFEKVVDAVGEREALVCGDRRLTYRQLEERSNRLAHHFLSLGVKPNDHIGIYAYNCVEWVEAMWAAWKVRAAAINVNFRYVEDELRYLFDNADLVALVHGPEFDPPFDGPVLEIGEAYDKAIAAESPERDFAPRSGDDHYVLYTGGTTGMPKGVVWRSEDAFFGTFGGGNPAGEPVKSEDELIELARNGEGVAYLVTAPLMHGAGQWVTGIGLLGGMKVVLLDGYSFDAERAWDLVEREKIVSIAIVGDAMARPLADTLEANPGRWDTSSLFVIGSGGAALSPTVKEQLGRLLPNTFVMDSFGASETGIQGRATVGRTFEVTENCAVFDENYQRVAPGSGVIGRLGQKGRVPLEYYKDPKKSAETFVEIEGDRWAFAGDMAVVEEDGTITLLGRGSASINTGGEKVFPEEVEDVLKAHPDVFDALVVGVPDERWGERVAAVVQPRAGAPEPTLDAVQAHCREHLAGYKVPRDLHVVEKVSRQPSGKPDYPWAKKVATGQR